MKTHICTVVLFFLTCASSREAHMEINDKYTHILTHIQQEESLSACGGRVRRDREKEGRMG